MQIHTENNELIFQLGRLRGEIRLPLSGIDSWDMLYESFMGRRYLAFHVGDRTHFVNLPSLSLAERSQLLVQLTGIVGFPPSTELLALERDNSHWLAAWEVVKQIGRYLRLFINPRAPLR